jgi:hypothetical protein
MNGTSPDMVADRAMLEPVTARRSRLGRVGETWLAVAVLGAIGIMGLAFWFSFANLSAAAASHGWHPGYLFPLAIDTIIPTYAIVDQLLTVLGSRSLLPRFGSWAGAALTVYLNWTLSAEPALVWRIAHAAMPALWILGIEVLRVIWKALRAEPEKRNEAVPLSRWLANPFTAFGVWRRKQLLGIKSWAVTSELEDARLFLRDTLRAIGAAKPDAIIPDAVRRVLRTGRFPANVRQAIDAGAEWGGGTRWEPPLEDWLASRLGLSQTIQAALTPPVQTPLPNPLSEGDSGGGPDPVSGGGSGGGPDTKSGGSGDDRSDPPGRALRKVLRQGCRKSSDEELVAAVGDIASGLRAEGKDITLGAVERGLKGPRGGIGPDRARRVFKAYQDETAQVVPIGLAAR